MLPDPLSESPAPAGIRVKSLYVSVIELVQFIFRSYPFRNKHEVETIHLTPVIIKGSLLKYGGPHRRAIKGVNLDIFMSSRPREMAKSLVF